MTDDKSWVGRILSDRYELFHELGSGGMAVVYRAHDRKLDREVAVKVMRDDISAALGSDRFRKEIKVLSSLTHSNIVALVDSGELDGSLYYVMPLIEGESLRDRLDREGSLPLEEAVAITVDVARALSHAHAFGIIHRDIKPANIMLSGGSALVADFGIAKAIGEAGSEKLTATGVAIGTVTYMSPEQSLGAGEVDHRSDQYALASVLYEMLINEPPFGGTNSQAILVRKSTETARPIRPIRETVSAELEEVVLRALSRHPADRYVSMREFADAVASVPARATAEQMADASAGGEAREEGLAPTATAEVHRRKVGWALVAIATVAVGSGIAALGVGKGGTPAVTSRAPIRIAFVPCTASREMQALADGFLNATVGRLQRVRTVVPLLSSATAILRAAGVSLSAIADSLGADFVADCEVDMRGVKLSVWDRRGSEIWDDMFEADNPNEEEIAFGLLAAIGVTPASDEVAAIRFYRSTSTVADSLYRLALNYFTMANDSLNTLSMELLNGAIEEDSTFAQAWAMLSMAHSTRYRNLGLLYTPSIERRAAVRTAQNALRLNDRVPESHIALGFTQAWMDFDFEAARASFDAASRLSPYHPQVLHLKAFLSAWSGHTDSAMAFIDKASEVAPLDQLSTLTRGFIYYLAGSYREAIEDYRWVNQIADDDPADGLLIWALIEDGQVGAARDVATSSCGDESTAMECWGMTYVEAAEGRAPRVFERLHRYRREIEEGMYAPGKTSWELNDHFFAAELFAMVGESDSAFTYLDEAYVGGSPFLARFRVDPHFKNLRNDARFEDLASRIGLPPLAN